ncbi:MAG: hypothetical protein HY996_00955 [Micrococcales bacterium]|nr:hypothetical protein [Micrococcales bacterium]
MTVVEGRSGGEASPRAVVRVRLRRAVLRTAVMSLAAAMLPLGLTLVVVIVGGGRWPALLAVELIVLLACLALVLRRRAVFVEVTDRVLRGNGIASPMETVPVEQIGAVHLVPTYVLGIDEPILQLLVTDRSGRRVFRMRGTYWEHGDLELVAAALPVRPHVVAEPIRLADFYAQYPTSEYWFENKLSVRILTVLSVCALSTVLAVALSAGA